MATEYIVVFHEDERGIARSWYEVGKIVRCADCKHRNTENGFCEGRGWPMQLVSDDGFCDKGERSEE